MSVRLDFRVVDPETYMEQVKRTGMNAPVLLHYYVTDKVTFGHLREIASAYGIQWVGGGIATGKKRMVW